MSLPDLWHNFTFSFMSLALNFEIQILSSHIIAYFVHFDSPIWNLKIWFHTTQLWAFSCMQTLLYVPAWFVTQLYFLLHVSRPEFLNLDIIRPYHSLFRYLWFTYFSYYFSCLEFQNWDFIMAYHRLLRLWSGHIITYFGTFDSPKIWTLKSDIIRGSYELSDALGRIGLSLLELWHNFTFSFMFLALSFKI